MRTIPPLRRAVHLSCLRPLFSGGNVAWLSPCSIVSSRNLHVTLRSDSKWDRIRHFFVAAETENFVPDAVQRSHKWDKLDDRQWMLIYRDLGAIRSFSMLALLFPMFIIGAIFLTIDITTKSSSEHAEVTKRLIRDAKEMGTFALIPSTALVIVTCILLRLHHCRLLRIYQNRSNPEDFIAVASRSLVSQKQVPFNRLECLSFYYAEEQSEGMRMALSFVLGNLIVGKRRYIIVDDSFRANNYRSYMLNETSTPPRL